jgi:hypothetical protein
LAAQTDEKKIDTKKIDANRTDPKDTKKKKSAGEQLKAVWPMIWELVRPRRIKGRQGVPELREARVFDVYSGPQAGAGRKSVAIHLSLQAPDRTLSDDEAAVVRGRIVAALGERFDAELRR